MKWAKRTRSVAAGRSAGRTTVASMAAVALVASSLVLITSVLPAGAGAGAPSSAGVQPTEQDLGGQPDDCAAVGSVASYELRIPNPQTGNVVPSAPAGVSFDLTVSGDDKLFDLAQSNFDQCEFSRDEKPVQYDEEHRDENLERIR